MKKYEFPENFYWGAATSGPQSEGITNKANLNVWDQWFIDEPDRFYNHWSANIACDTYNRYKEDVQLMKEIKLNSIRTSIQWTRLIKDFKTCELDQDGVDFYNNYIDEMLKNGIEPFINLYHFDMPAILMEQYGGFESLEVVEMFVAYAKKCFELFGDRIKYFTVFNEPLVPVEFGYFYDAHRPNKVDPKLGVQVAFNTMLAQAKTVAVYKQLNLDGEIGTILNLTPVYPRSSYPADLEASKMCDLIFNKSFMDPSVKGEFPKELVDELRLNALTPDCSQEQLLIIKNNTVDFIGLNYYVPRRVCAPKHDYSSSAPWMPDKYFDYYTMPGSRNNPHRDGNEIYPKAVYDIAVRVKHEYGNIRWYLAEIGISITSEESLINSEGVIDDSFRTQLMKEHLVQLHKAVAEGSNCFGVHQWTLIDNWSWLNSHRRRYGFYYLDLETRNRKKKAHAVWFKQLIENNGFEY